MRAVSRSPRQSRRRFRLEALEGRAMLSTAMLDGDLGLVPTWIAAGEIAPLSVTIGPDPGADGGALATELPLSNGDWARPWQFTLALPWRVAARPMDGRPDPVEMPEMPEVDRPHDVIGTAQVLPVMPMVRVGGEVSRGQGLDVFALPIDSSTRMLRLSYHRLSPGGGPDSQPFRVWLKDGEGVVIESWLMGPGDDGLDLRMFALASPPETMLFVGIEAVGPAGESAGPISYALEVLRDAAAQSSPISAPAPNQAEPPPFGGNTGGGSWGEPAADPGPALIPVIGTSDGAGYAPLDASGGGGLGLGLLDVEAPLPIDLGGGVLRELPTQGAASVGGLLPAGPDVRGEANPADRIPRVDEFADPLLLAVEPVDPDDLGEVAEGEAATSSVTDGPIAVAASGAVPAGPAPVAWPRASMAGPGGLPMLVAGLRIAWGTPAVPPSEAGAPLPPEDLAVLAASLPPELDRPGGGTAEPGSPGAEPGGGPVDAPMRPRVLRTALIGAAALSVGLLLPELAPERPGSRRRRPSSAFSWRPARPHHI